MRLLSYLFITLVCVPVWAAETTQDELPDDKPISASPELYFEAEKMLLASARRYVKAFSSPDERRKWEKKIDGRIDTRIEDGDMGDRDAIFQRLALDWVVDNEKRVRRKDPKAIKVACFMFLRFIERRIHLPLQIRNRITLSDCHEIVREVDMMVEDKDREAENEKGKQG